MLTYAMEGRDGEPLYEYLYRRIRDDILRGTLTVGERLPSRRALADHLRVSVITVEGAYRQLEAEGYVYTVPRRGVFVSLIDRRPPPAAAPDAVPDGDAVPDAVSDAAPDAVPAALDLGSNRTDPARFPAAAWARLTRRVLSEDPSAPLEPPPHQGLLRLRRALAADLRDYRGMSVSAEQIVVGAGAEYLYILLAQLLGGPFALEDPGYPKIRMVYGRCGVRTIPVPLDRHGLNPDALAASGAAAAHISPAHHYPTGTVTPIARRHALLRWAERTEGVLIEDDYDSEFRFTGRPIPTLQSIDSGGRVVYMNTFSQTISPAMRLGYMVLPPRLLEAYRRELDFYACPVPVLEQHVLARFLEDGLYEKHLSRLRKEYRTRREAVLETFRHCAFAGRVSVAEQGAGLHFLLKLDTGEDDGRIRARAAAAGVRLSFLADFAAVPRPGFAHTLVVNYAPLPTDHLPEAVDLLGRVLFPSR